MYDYRPMRRRFSYSPVQWIFFGFVIAGCPQEGGFLNLPDVDVQPGTNTSTTNTSTTTTPGADGGVVMTVTNPNMSFFVTSRTVERNGQPVSGGNLGGLAGADQFCTTLANEALPNNGRTWRAYLSTTTVDAIDRIGSGPWLNALGETIANNAAELIATPPLETQFRDERGRWWSEGPSRRHDVLTGSNLRGRKFVNLSEMTNGFNNPGGSLFTAPDGTFSYTPSFDFSCNDWTSDSNANFAVVGHLDWNMLTRRTGSDQWSTSHVSACSRDQMARNGGDIRLYCFAID